MMTICKCKYCGHEFEAKRRDARCCPDRKCQNARWRELYRQRPEPPPPVFLLECRTCGKKFKSTDKRARYCSKHCQTVATGHYRPDPRDGIEEADTERIDRRRREVYARMAATSKPGIEVRGRIVGGNTRTRAILPRS